MRARLRRRSPQQAQVEGRVVGHQNRVLGKVVERRQRRGQVGGIGHHGVGDVMDRGRGGRDRPARIDQRVEALAGQPAPRDADAGDLHDPVRRQQAGGFGVEHHAGQIRQARRGRAPAGQGKVIGDARPVRRLAACGLPVGRLTGRQPQRQHQPGDAAGIRFRPDPGSVRGQDRGCGHAGLPRIGGLVQPAVQAVHGQGAARPFQQQPRLGHLVKRGAQTGGQAVVPQPVFQQAQDGVHRPGLGQHRHPRQIGRDGQPGGQFSQRRAPGRGIGIQDRGQPVHGLGKALALVADRAGQAGRDRAVQGIQHRHQGGGMAAQRFQRIAGRGPFGRAVAQDQQGAIVHPAHPARQARAALGQADQIRGGNARGDARRRRLERAGRDVAQQRAVKRQPGQEPRGRGVVEDHPPLRIGHHRARAEIGQDRFQRRLFAGQFGGVILHRLGQGLGRAGARLGRVAGGGAQIGQIARLGQVGGLSGAQPARQRLDGAGDMAVEQEPDPGDCPRRAEPGDQPGLQQGIQRQARRHARRGEPMPGDPQTQGEHGQNGPCQTRKDQ